VSACGKALDGCAIDAQAMLPGIERGSMKLLAGWIAESDLALIAMRCRSQLSLD
jgi:hypothetical protein